MDTREFNKQRMEKQVLESSPVFRHVKQKVADKKTTDLSPVEMVDRAQEKLKVILQLAKYIENQLEKPSASIVDQSNPHLSMKLNKLLGCLIDSHGELTKAQQILNNIK